VVVILMKRTVRCANSKAKKHYYWQAGHVHMHMLFLTRWGKNACKGHP